MSISTAPRSTRIRGWADAPEIKGLESPRETVRGPSSQRSEGGRPPIIVDPVTVGEHDAEGERGALLETRRKQKVIPTVPIDLPEVIDAPDKVFEDPNDPAQMERRRAYELELAQSGVKLLTPQFPELFKDVEPIDVAAHSRARDQVNTAAGVPGAPGFLIEEETSDDFLDAPELVYEPDGKTLLQRLAAEGYDISDLGTLADQIEQRTGRKVPELPPLNDGG